MDAEKKLMNRWLVVGGAILIQFCLGAIYAWSVFTNRITAVDGDYGFTAKQAAWVFSAGLASFAVVMVIVGPWAKKQPRKAAGLGGVVLGLGYILGGFLGSSFAAQLICIGLIGGAGIGIAYVVPIAVGMKWFPDKKGMVAGLGVAGFGFGATLWVKLAGSWFGGLLNTTSLFNLPGVQSVFVIYGIVFLVVVLVGSIVMVDPPEGYKPEGWEPPAPGEGVVAAGIDLTSREMLATPQYYMLLLMFIGSALAGLMVIYCIRLFGIDALMESGAAMAAVKAKAGGLESVTAAADAVKGGRLSPAEWAATTAGTAMAWYAILNGLGRIVWGTVSDKIGRKAALFAMCLLQGIVMLAFLKLGGSAAGLIIGACIIGFNFGGNFALFPTATADMFGTKNLGPNYGWVFLAYGVAGIAGPQVAGYFKDAAKTSGAGVAAWTTPFVVAGISCLVAAVIALFLKPVKAAPAPAEGTLSEATEK